MTFPRVNLLPVAIVTVDIEAERRGLSIKYKDLIKRGDERRLPIFVVIIVVMSDDGLRK